MGVCIQSGNQAVLQHGKANERGYTLEGKPYEGHGGQAGVVTGPLPVRLFCSAWPLPQRRQGVT